MKLTDQEQVILKAIYHIGRNGIAPIASVVKAVGYPKAMTKKLLVKMAGKGVVSLHRHDYPTSLLSAERKLLVRRQDGQGRWHYFSAVSVREGNPMGKHLPGLSAKAQRQYEHILESAKKYHRYGKRKKEVAARTVKAGAKNPKKTSKGKTALKKTGKALKGFARGALSAGSQILGAGAEALNPVRRRAKKAKKKAGKRNASRTSRLRKASSSRNPRVVSEVDRKPLRTQSKKRITAKRKASSTARTKSRVRTRKATTSRLAGKSLKKSSGLLKRKRRNGDRIWQVYGHNKTAKGAAQEFARTYWAEPRKITGFKPDGTFKVVRGLRTYRIFEDGDLWVVEVVDDPIMSQSRHNPSAEAIRKKFAGRVSGERDVFVPSSAPKGKLAKLGKLVSITTEEGTIKPIHGQAVLLADTNGKLHIGSLSGAPLFDGPRRSFGQVRRIEYDDSKPHLGFKSPIIWHHKMGEESGHRPTLHADGQGGLVFRGGRYRLTARGIEN